MIYDNGSHRGSSLRSDFDSNYDLEPEFFWCWWRLGLRFDWISALLAHAWCGVVCQARFQAEVPTLEYNLSAFNELTVQQHQIEREDNGVALIFELRNIFIFTRIKG